MSPAFKEGQGIQQGGVSSTGIFKAKVNPCLDRLSDHHLEALAKSEWVHALIVAVDLVLTVNTSDNVQGLVSEAHLDASREWFNCSKTKLY